MAHALPVVATPEAVAGVIERSGPEVFGAIADAPSDFADAVSRFLVDRDDAIKVGARARSWVATAYDFERSVRGVLKSYSDIGRSRETG
jgi:glycosyltransferase involved in cell wall biosynthesis